MSKQIAPDRFLTHAHRLVNLLGYLLIVVVALRRINDLDTSFSIGLALFLLGLFTVFYTIEPRLPQHWNSHRWAYFLVQMALVQMLGLFQEYQDTWALLYAVLGFQVALCYARKAALVWGGLFVASILVTLCAEFGVISGLGRAVAYIVIGVFFISYDIQYSRNEDALEESQILLTELQEAHQKLGEYAAQAEKLATAQERNRMIQELHDSVGQKVFAIQLAGEAIRIIVEKDPQRAADQLCDLQGQTQAALSQMRQLISQWRPN
jgi:signal transduction histidine kinase